MPQLQINQGPQDALLYDNSRSYFTNVGYVRTSNFQTEYRDVQSQNSPAFGSTVQYVIPKAADLLGPTDLMVTIPAPKTKLAEPTKAGDVAYMQWVDELGFAMIEKITFSVGSNDIETITGEQLQIQNELMTTDEMRLGWDQVMKSGRPAFANSKILGGTLTQTGDQIPSVDFDTAELPGDNQSTHTHTTTNGTTSTTGGQKVINKDFSRLLELKYAPKDTAAGVAAFSYLSGKRYLTIPLGLFFTKHVSQYFPLAAVAGCNDVRISIKFRSLKELIQLGGRTASGGTAQSNSITSISDFDGQLEAKLRCHYVHVTGPEAQVLMNKEHVRLLKLYQHEHKLFTGINSGKLEMDLSFLHPVSTLLITIRREDDMNSDLGSIADDQHANGDAAGKGFFFYHGDGTPPNYDQLPYAIKAGATGTHTGPGTVKVSSVALTLNGQERHPGLEKGIEYDYLMKRLMPMLHSNSNQYNKQLLAFDSGKTTKLTYGSTGGHSAQFFAQQGSKNIMVYPFSLNPEGSNPSGAVNFSKVSHAKLSLHLDTSTGYPATSELHTTTAATIGIGMPGCTKGLTGSGACAASSLRVDVYALYYNWLQIKDGRALLSFA